MESFTPRFFLNPHVLLGLILLPLAPALDAALVVDWGGNYVGTNTNYGNATEDGPSNIIQHGGFSAGAPLLLSPSSGYSGTSATFYGEILRGAGTGTGTIGYVSNSGSADRIDIKQNNSDVSALLLWKQTDFLNSLNTGTLNFGAGSTVTTTLDTYVLGVPGRAVVKSAGGYYISSAIFSASGTTAALDLTTLDWFSYDPASNLNTIGSAHSFSGGVIANVTEIGFFTGVTTGGANAVRVSSLEFNYVAGVVAPIPEPSSYALLAGGLSILFVTSRRRRQSVS